MWSLSKPNLLSKPRLIDAIELCGLGAFQVVAEAAKLAWIC
jgi:hypothetical protein